MEMFLANTNNNVLELCLLSVCDGPAAYLLQPLTSSLLGFTVTDSMGTAVEPAEAFPDGEMTTEDGNAFHICVTCLSAL